MHGYDNLTIRSVHLILRHHSDGRSENDGNQKSHRHDPQVISPDIPFQTAHAAHQDRTDHAGEEIKMEYLLSADSLNNIVLAPLHVGDKVFVNITEAEDGSIKGEISNSWSTVQRINYVICFGIIVAILLLIYAGKKGINTILITLIIIIACTIIVPVFVYEGKGSMWISAFASIAVIAAISSIICFWIVSRPT